MSINNEVFISEHLNPDYLDLYHSMVVANRAAYIGTGVKSDDANQYAIEVAQEVMTLLYYATSNNN